LSWSQLCQAFAVDSNGNRVLNNDGTPTPIATTDIFATIGPNDFNGGRTDALVVDNNGVVHHIHFASLGRHSIQCVDNTFVSKSHILNAFNVAGSSNAPIVAGSLNINAQNAPSSIYQWTSGDWLELGRFSEGSNFQPAYQVTVDAYLSDHTPWALGRSGNGVSYIYKNEWESSRVSGHHFFFKRAYIGVESNGVQYPYVAKIAVANGQVWALAGTDQSAPLRVFESPLSGASWIDHTLDGGGPPGGINASSITMMNSPEPIVTVIQVEDGTVNADTVWRWTAGSCIQ
jgi:hypothetical protein